MSHLNYHFKSSEGKSYNERFDELVEQEIISTRGLKKDATHFDEILFDVNTRYFEERGGYEYAKEFFKEAYEFAKEKYGEDKIISAVMHADEINEVVTAELGRPVYHYHLHVIAIPTVRKEVLYTKRCKDIELRGTVKEVLTQVSHSKMWESKPKLDEKGEPVLNASGKPIIEKSYSILQDDFYKHMVKAGFRDFERGERGSTADHLSDLDFKIKKDTERFKEVQKNLEVSAEYGDKVGELTGKLESIEGIGDKTFIGNLTGKVKIDEKDFKTLYGLAEVGIAAQKELLEKEKVIADKDVIIKDQEWSIRNLKSTISDLKKEVKKIQESFDNFKEEVKDFVAAVRLYPKEVGEFIAGLKERFAKEQRQKQEEYIRLRKERSRDDWER